MKTNMNLSEAAKIFRKQAEGRPLKDKIKLLRQAKSLEALERMANNPEMMAKHNKKPE